MEEEGDTINNNEDNDVEIIPETMTSDNNGPTIQEDDTNVIQNSPFIVQEFNDLEDAYAFYNNYGKSWGFSVRRSRKVKNVKGEVTSAAFVCSCQGVREAHKGPQKRESPMEIRFQCMAMFRVSLNKTNNKWVADIFKSQHTHDPVRQNQVHYLRSHRGLTEADKADLRVKKDARMKPSQAIKLAVHCAGGHDKLGYTVKDGLNFSTKDRAERISEGDAATALAYLESKKSTDPHFFLRYTTDEEKRLHFLFWTDNICRADISCFAEPYSNERLVGPMGWSRPNQAIYGLIQTESKL
ncbi:unnamed protein product [Linum trigynum]|uniref:FAR1 domain-containing protein n=1 Tax=Linum trigynum TaxID=586398 RepID=A0AAV2EBB1_9ROSI